MSNGLAVTQFLNHPVPQAFARLALPARSALGRGFTLIEMLVVLMILGLFAGLVTTIVQPDDRAMLRVEAERLAQLLHLAAMESRFSGKRIAWTSDGPSYHFWRFAADTDWTEIRDVDTLRPRTLPQGMKIAGLSVENVFAREQMRIEFTSSGPSLTFVIEMTYGAANYSVQGSPVGKVRVLPDEQNVDGTPAPQ